MGLIHLRITPQSLPAWVRHLDRADTETASVPAPNTLHLGASSKVLSVWPGCRGSVRRGLQQESTESPSSKDSMCPCCCPVHPPRSHPTKTLEAKPWPPTPGREPRVCRGSLTCLEATQWVDRDLPSRLQETALHTNSKMGRGTSLVVWFPIKTGLTIMTIINRSDLAPPVSYPQLPQLPPQA